MGTPKLNFCATAQMSRHRTEIWNIILQADVTRTGSRAGCGQRKRNTVDPLGGRVGDCFARALPRAGGKGHVSGPSGGARQPKRSPMRETLRSGDRPSKKDRACAGPHKSAVFCHSIEMVGTEVRNWRVRRVFRYRPGDDLEVTTPIIRPSRVQEIPGLGGLSGRESRSFCAIFSGPGRPMVPRFLVGGLQWVWSNSPVLPGRQILLLIPVTHSMKAIRTASWLKTGPNNRACQPSCHERFREHFGKR